MSKSIVFLLVTAVCSSIVGISGTITWVLAGGLLKKYINRYYRVFNILIALILVWSALKLILA
ncbi:hypothetical protein ACTPC6_05795 [Clostridioides difficile]